MNAITVLFLSELIPPIINLISLPNPQGGTWNLRDYLYEFWLVPPFADSNMSSLACALSLVMIWAMILWTLYKYQVIISTPRFADSPTT